MEEPVPHVPGRPGQRAQDAPEVAVEQLCSFTLELLAKSVQALSRSM